ncbi:MAG: arsenite methyltransferase [Thermoplasmata archaeon]|nr:MAG: arsenite methyltransferase [Thermoplasmata archaeon]
MEKDNTKKIVRENYAKIARTSSSCCGSPQQDSPGSAQMNPCCGGAADSEQKQNVSKILGYSDEELQSLPEGADLGLGCGNPVALASLKEGDTYVDLGSGAGIDCFLAAQKVGKSGKVIGVDMTPDMIDKARENAKKGNYENVEFRLGEIEHLPVADNTVDVITSNCVINLSPDKKAVFEEAFRILKPGGRLMISDVVLLKPLPEAILNSIEAYVGCVSGAMLKNEYLQVVQDVGFEDIEIKSEVGVPADIWFNDPIAKSIIEGLNISEDDAKDVAASIVSLKFSAVKPENPT